MKKHIRSLLIMMLCLMLACPAYALGITPAAAPAEGALSLLPNSNCLTLHNGQMSKLLRVDGTPVLAGEYVQFEGFGRYIAVREAIDNVNSGSVYDEDGNLIIPAAYGNIEISDGWAVCMVRDPAAKQSMLWGEPLDVQRVDIYRLDTGRCVAQLTPEQYAQHETCSDSIVIQDAAGNCAAYDTDFNLLGEVPEVWDKRYVNHQYQRFTENDLVGVKDAQGNVIVPAAYKSVTYVTDDGWFVVSDGAKQGVLDAQGNSVLPVAYDRVVSFTGMPGTEIGNQYLCAFGRYFGVMDEGSIAFVDTNGNILYEQMRGDIYAGFNGAVIQSMDEAHNSIIIAPDGTVSEVGPVAVMPSHYTGSMYMIVRNQQTGGVGLIDWYGNELLPCEYTSIKTTFDGRFAACYTQNGMSFYELTYPGFGAEDETASAAAAEPAAPAAPETPAAPVVSSADKVVSEAALKLYAGSLGDKYAVSDSCFLTDYAEYAVFGLDGEKITDSTYYTENAYADLIFGRRTDIADEYAIDNTGGILNAEGKELTPFIYGAADFGGNWVVCYVVEPAADEENYDLYLYNGLADIISADIYRMSDMTCMAHMTRDEFENFSAECDIITIKNRTTGVRTAYDDNFNPLGEVNITSVATEKMQYQRFTENDKTGIRDAQGNVIVPAAYDTVSVDTCDEYFVVKDNGLYGVLDANGNVIVPVVYDGVFPTYEGRGTPVGGSALCALDQYIMVSKDGNLGYVDKNGNVTCAIQYPESSIFLFNGASMVMLNEDGSRTVISADGVESRHTDYSRIRPLYRTDGVFLTTETEDSYKEGLIDWHGNVLLPCEYDALTVTADGRFLVAESMEKGTFVYELVYPEFESAPAAAAPEAPAVPEATQQPAAEAAVSQQQPAGGSALSTLLGGLLGGGSAPAAPTEAPAVPTEAPAAPTEAPAQAPAESGDTSLLENCLVIIDNNLPGASASVLVLLDLADDTITDAAALQVLASAKILLETDGDAALPAVRLLIENALALMK